MRKVRFRPGNKPSATLKCPSGLLPSGLGKCSIEFAPRLAVEDALRREKHLVSYATDFLQPQRVAQLAFSPLEAVEMTA